MCHRVVVPFDLETCAAQPVRRRPSVLHWHHWIKLAVCREDRHRGVRRARLQDARQRQPGRQREQAREFFFRPDRRVDRNRTALRKPCDDDSTAVDAAFFLAFDQRLENRRAVLDACLVDGSFAVKRDDVIPGTHCHTAVDRHGTHRRMRKNESEAKRGRQPQFRNDRFEVMAVSAQPVQPDHRAGRRVAGLNFYGVGDCHASRPGYWGVRRSCAFYPQGGKKSLTKYAHSDISMRIFMRERSCRTRPTISSSGATPSGRY